MKQYNLVQSVEIWRSVRVGSRPTVRQWKAKMVGSDRFGNAKGRPGPTDNLLISSLANYSYWPIWKMALSAEYWYRPIWKKAYQSFLKPEEGFHFSMLRSSQFGQAKGESKMKKLRGSKHEKGKGCWLTQSWKVEILKTKLTTLKPWFFLTIATLILASDPIIFKVSWSDQLWNEVGSVL